MGTFYFRGVSRRDVTALWGIFLYIIDKSVWELFYSLSLNLPLSFHPMICLAWCSTSVVIDVKRRGEVLFLQVISTQKKFEIFVLLLLVFT